MKTAWVLAGGGAHGAVQAGMMKGLLPFGVPDFMVGTSVGALNAAGFSRGGMNRLHDIWKSIRSEGDIFSGNYWVTYPWKLGLKNAKPLRKIVESLNQPAGVPYDVCATNLTFGRIEYCESSDPDILDFTVASASIEAYVEPVVIRGSYFGDGGAIENAPVERALSRGAERIFVLLCSPLDTLKLPFEPRNAIEILERTYSIRQMELLEADLSRHAGEAEIHIIEPRKEVLLSVRDFDPDRIRFALQYGEDLASAWLEERAERESRSRATI